MTSELPNIPPFWNAFAYWLAYLMYLQYMPRKLGKKRWFYAVTVLLLAILIGYMWVISPLNGFWFNLGMFGTALQVLLPFALLCNNGVWNDLYYCSRSFILGGFMSALGWQMYMYFCGKIPAIDGTAGEAAFMLTVYLAVRLAMYFLERGHKLQIYEMPVPKVSCISAMAIAYVVYVMSSISFASIETPFGSSTYAEAYNFRTIIYLAGVAMLYAHHIQICESFVSLEKDMLQNMLNMQYVNYQMNQESVDIVNRKYHDLKHQIAILRSEIPGEQKTEYLDQMEKEISTYETQNKTGNKYLDTILTGKSIRCQREQISLTCVADGAQLDFMDVMDMSVLFGNALDNAIEAVCKLNDPEQRLIHLSVNQEKGFVRIHIENRCADDFVVKNRFPGTSKMDTRYHGFGLKSIKKTVDKYHGSLTIHAEGGWFELRILLPVKREA